MSDTAQPSNSPITKELSSLRCVRVCQYRACQRQGAAEVLGAFRALLVPGVTVTSSGCLAQCGNGPMVLVLPDQVWYGGVKPEEVPLLVEQHLLGGQRVKQMLYYRFHPQG